ncbi:MAG: sulfotransferase family protein [Saprospiraceae bacterium]|nr:sulfotransferase family protein [Saprospiraceae bacterium]
MEKLIKRKITISKFQSPQPLIINEAVNFDKEVIFIAVPKTGTTSIRVQLRGVGEPIVPNPHLNILQIRDLFYIYFLKKYLGNNRDFPNNNVLSDLDIRQTADQTFRQFFKFAAVRNPWARAVSLYYRREGVQMSQEQSFEEFCTQHIYASDTCFHPTLHQNQLDWLCDEQENCIVDYVYKVEDFQQAIREIKAQTNGRVCLEMKEANKNPNSRSANYRDLYNDKTRKMIAKRFEKDIDYFKYTF